MKKIFVVLAMAAAFAACGTKAVDAAAEGADSTAVDSVEVVDSVAVDSVVAE